MKTATHWIHVGATVEADRYVSAYHQLHGRICQGDFRHVRAGARGPVLAVSLKAGRALVQFPTRHGQAFAWLDTEDLVRPSLFGES